MDVTLIVKQMIEKGASEQEIKNNLSDLGVENIDDVYKQAKQKLEEEAKTQKPQQTQPAGKEPQISDIEITNITSEGEKKVKLEDIMKDSESIEPESKVNTTDLTALLKSIEELNKKILETNREILLKLKLRE